jgi:hypothetical protein
MPKVRTRIIRKTRGTSKGCAKAKMTKRISGITTRRGTLRKTKTRKLTSLATSGATEAITPIINTRNNRPDFWQ